MSWGALWLQLAVDAQKVKQTLEMLGMRLYGHLILRDHHMVSFQECQLVSNLRDRFTCYFVLCLEGRHQSLIQVILSGQAQDIIHM